MAASLAVTAAATGVSAYSQHKQGQYQNKMAKHQAKLDQERARLAQENAAMEKADADRQRRQMIASGLTAAAANGVMLESSQGSAIAMWEQDQEAELAWDKAKIQRNADLQSWGFERNAEMTRSQGKMDNWAGNMGAAGTLIGGAGDMMSKGGSMYFAVTK